MMTDGRYKSNTQATKDRALDCAKSHHGRLPWFVSYTPQLATIRPMSSWVDVGDAACGAAAPPKTATGSSLWS
jgi:hypothetical protein